MKRRKEEEREGTEEEKKITFCRMRGRDRERGDGREVGKKRIEESKGGR